jgi:cysteine desulfurase family protein
MRDAAKPMAQEQSSNHFIYMNNAATAWPRAPGVADAVCAALNAPPASAGRATGGDTAVLGECRSRIASLLGVSTPERIILTSGATLSLNIAIHGLALNPGDRAVTSVFEHNSMLRPLAHIQDRAGIAVDIVGLDSSGFIDSQDYETALSRAPRLVALNHVSNVTGAVQNVKPLFAQARAAGAVTLLDASQSLGHMPVNAEELNADIVAFTGHKGLRGPAGTGGLYVAPSVDLEPVIVGGTGVRSDLRRQPEDMPLRLEAGTPNMPAFAGLAAALHWLEQYGADFMSREHALGQRLNQGLSHIPGVRIFSAPDQTSQFPGIVSFSIQGWSVEEAGFVLSESHGIACRTGLHCAPLIHGAVGSAPRGTVRLSVSGFNTMEHVDAAIAAVEQLASCAS